MARTMLCATAQAYRTSKTRWIVSSCTLVRRLPILVRSFCGRLAVRFSSILDRCDVAGGARFGYSRSVEQLIELAPQLTVAFGIVGMVVWLQKKQGAYAKASDLAELRTVVEEIHETVIRLDERQKARAALPSQPD